METNQLRKIIKKYRSHFQEILIRYEEAMYHTMHGLDLNSLDLTKSCEVGFTVTISKNKIQTHLCTNSLQEIELFLKKNSEELNGTVYVPDSEDYTKIDNNPQIETYENTYRNNIERTLFISEILSLASKHNLSIGHFSYSDIYKYILILNDKEDSKQQKQNINTFFAHLYLNTDNSFSLPLSLSDYEGLIGINIIEREMIKIKKILQKINQEGVSPPSGVFDVILSPDLAGTLIHETIGHPSEGDTFHNNILQLGEIVTNTNLNIWDVPLDCPGFDYDEEGEPSSSIKIVENGRLINTLDRKLTSSNKKLSGNGRAVNYRFTPICRMKQTYVEAGNTSLKEMIKNIGTGLYLVGYKEGDTFEGSFSISCLYGYYIENGRLSFIFPGVLLRGKIKNVLLNICDISNNVQLTRDAGGCNKDGQNGLPNEMKSPSLQIKNLEIGENIDYVF